MGKILSQEEIDSLLTSAREVEERTHQQDVHNALPTGDVTVYNFRRPDRVSKDQIRSLHFLHDRFARNVATSLSAYLRAATDVTIISVEQFTYSEFLMSLPDPTAFYALSLPPVDGFGALELNPTIAFPIVNRMLGGSGQASEMNRQLTEIEQNVIDAVVKVILENLTEAWRTVLDVQFRIYGRETRPQMLQVAAPNEVVILLVFDIKIGDARGMLNLCVPAAVGSSFAQGWHGTSRTPSALERRRLHDNLARIDLPVTAAFDTLMTARELLTVRRGEVLSLGHPAGEPIEVRVGHAVKFVGHPVRTASGVGVKVAQVVPIAAAEAH
jgi:flagellar motor switch protein FliM